MLRPAAVLLCGLLVGCRDSQPAGADAAPAIPTEQVFERYARIKDEALKVNVGSFATGDVALAKGRRIATVLYSAHVDWANNERALGGQNAEASRLLERLSSPRAPYCPNNDLSLCSGHPWFADDPTTAGVIVYVEQRSAQDGVYGGPGGASAYSTELQFDAILLPEKLRVARWWRLALPPQSQLDLGTGAGMAIGRQTSDSFEGDMQKLRAGTAPVGDLDDPWRDAGTPAKRDR